MMFSIIEHIEYLITRHDCVVIPNWGAFIANYNIARYNEDSYLMERPHRTISFNDNITHNDGLLAQSLMRREGLSYDEAVRFIADSVTTFRQQLVMDCEVSMGRMGYFRRNQGHFIEFVPFFNVHACDHFYGLADLYIHSVSSLEEEKAKQEALLNEVEPPTTPLPKERNLFSRKASQIAASVAVLIGLGVLLSTPIIVDRNHQDMASLTPAVTAPQTQQLGTTVQQGVVNSGIEVIEDNSPFAKIGNSSGKYYMVIATVLNQRELNAFKNKYPSLVPYMKTLDYKGMMCVYVARSDNYNQLMNLRSELPKQLRDVWIYN